jgi:hypothetical protein
VGLLVKLICHSFHPLVDVTLDEKIRYGMLALSVASLMLATLGMHVIPIDVGGGIGGTLGHGR